MGPRVVAAKIRQIQGPEGLISQSQSVQHFRATSIDTSLSKRSGLNHGILV
jgi:hypothetical protein